MSDKSRRKRRDSAKLTIHVIIEASKFRQPFRTGCFVSTQFFFRRFNFGFRFGNGRLNLLVQFGPLRKSGFANISLLLDGIFLLPQRIPLSFDLLLHFFNPVKLSLEPSHL